MRLLTSAIIVAGTLLTVAPASAQTYDPRYPVCLHVYSKGANWIDCRYASIPQCEASASGRAAQCEVNPFYAYAGGWSPAPPYRSRSYRRPN